MERADEARKLAPGPFLDALNSAVVQSFFCHRAYLLIKRQIWLPIVVGVSSVALRVCESKLIDLAPYRHFVCIYAESLLPFKLTISLGSTLAVLIIFSGVSAVAEANKVFVPELREPRF